MEMPVVVVPNWNGKDSLRDCLVSLRTQSLQAHIIVVDNGSADGSVALVAEFEVGADELTEQRTVLLGKEAFHHEVWVIIEEMTGLVDGRSDRVILRREPGLADKYLFGVAKNPQFVKRQDSQLIGFDANGPER